MLMKLLAWPSWPWFSGSSMHLISKWGFGNSADVELFGVLLASFSHHWMKKIYCELKLTARFSQSYCGRSPNIMSLSIIQTNTTFKNKTRNRCLPFQFLLTPSLQIKDLMQSQPEGGLIRSYLNKGNSIQAV